MDNDLREDICIEGAQQEDESTPFVAGLNDSLAAFGKQLHVQTELLRRPGLCITTQVFSNGRVLLSRKSECTSEFMNSRGINRIREMMIRQHRQVIGEIQLKSAQILARQGSR